MATATRTKAPTLPQIVEQIESLQAQASTLAEQAAALTEQLKMARGTRDGVKKDNLPDTSEIYNKIVHMIKQRPMRYHEIVDAMGASDPLIANRVNGALTRIKRDKVGLVNLGNERIALYFIPDAEILERLRSRAVTTEP